MTKLLDDALAAVRDLPPADQDELARVILELAGIEDGAGEVGTNDHRTSMYDSDPVVWSEAQTALLRQVAAGERPGGLDWENIIEEIEDVGRSLIHAVESLLLQALLHALKAALWPASPYVEGWLNEVRLFQVQAARLFRPSILQRIDPAALAADVVRAVPKTIDGAEPAIAPEIFMAAIEAELVAWLASPATHELGLERPA